MIKHLKYIFGLYHPEEEINKLKKEVRIESVKTQIKAKMVNKLLYNKDTTFYLGKAMGVIR